MRTPNKNPRNRGFFLWEKGGRQLRCRPLIAIDFSVFFYYYAYSPVLHVVHSSPCLPVGPRPIRMWVRYARNAVAPYSIWQKHQHGFGPSKNRSFRHVPRIAVSVADAAMPFCVISDSVAFVFVNSPTMEWFLAFANQAGKRFVWPATHPLHISY